MNSKQTPIIRTAYPYRTDEEKEYIKNYERKLEEKNMTHEDSVREIFEKIGINKLLDIFVVTLYNDYNSEI